MALYIHNKTKKTIDAFCLNFKDEKEYKRLFEIWHPHARKGITPSGKHCLFYSCSLWGEHAVLEGDYFFFDERGHFRHFKNVEFEQAFSLYGQTSRCDGLVDVLYINTLDILSHKELSPDVPVLQVVEEKDFIDNFDRAMSQGGYKVGELPLHFHSVITLKVYKFKNDKETYFVAALDSDGAKKVLNRLFGKELEYAEPIEALVDRRW